MKNLIKLLAALTVIVVSIYVVMLYQNNHRSEPVSDQRIAQSYERGVSWLLAHREEIVRDYNTALWSMLGESARVSKDNRVQQLYEEFVANIDRVDPYSVWQAYFHPLRFHNAVILPSEYKSFVDYQQHFLYALTCSQSLSKVPLIQAQNGDPYFCWHGARMIRPACVTHQLMAFRFIKKNRCDVDNLDAKIAVLQNTIAKQLTWDPRVVDVYVQRVLMLVDTGAGDHVKPRWLERVLDAQLPDGGWSDMEPLVPLGGGRYFGFDAKAVKVAKPVSNFHATAQGVLLMSLLQSGRVYATPGDERSGGGG